MNFQTFSPGRSVAQYTKNIIMTCNSTVVYKSFVNENAFFQTTIDIFSLCYVLQALHILPVIPPIFAEKLFFEHFVFELCTCNAFAPLCLHALGLYKHTRLFFINALIFSLYNQALKCQNFCKAQNYFSRNDFD